MRTSVQRAAGLVCAALLAFAGYWSVRLARADLLSREISAGQRAGAWRLAPANADYWLRWADLVEETGALAPEAYQRAAALDPYDAAVWIRLGLQAEAAGNFGKAEQALLHAAEVNRQYEPRWTLASYYFRRGDADRFWPWAKSALKWSYGERRPLFELCWNLSKDPDLIFRKGIPEDPGVHRDYLAYLLAEGRLDAAEAVGVIIEDQAGAADREALLQFTGRMLDSRRWSPALAAWNSLARRKVLRYAALDPERGSLLTNSDFQLEPLQAGFDWRTPDLPGVTVLRDASPAALRITFAGKQPERCEVLQQIAPVRPGANYRLTFEYQTAGIQPETGLRWKVFGDNSGVELRVRATDLSSREWRESAAEFTAPPQSQVVRLALNYERLRGTARIEGDVWLRNLRLAVVR